MSRRRSGSMRGRPGRLRDFQRQYRRKPWRCHPTTVAGETISSASFQPAQHQDIQTQNRRSHGRSLAEAPTVAGSPVAGVGVGPENVVGRQDRHKRAGCDECERAYTTRV